MGRRENTVLRAQLDPNLVYVIPNALIADQFKPSPVVNDPEHSKSSFPTLEHSQGQGREREEEG